MISDGICLSVSAITYDETLGPTVLLQLPSFHCCLCLISHCVCLLRLCFGGNILRCRPPTSPVLPPEAPGEGPSCLFQLLGAPGGPGLVATSLPSLSPSSRGFSSVSGSPLLSLGRTLSLEGGPPSSRRTSSQTLPVASPLCLLCYGDTC